MASLSIPYSDFVSGTTIVSQQVDDNNAAIVNYINARNSASTTWDAVSTVGAFTSTLTSNQIILGTTRTVTITAGTPASLSRVWTIPDISSAGTFAALEGTQTFSGSKTFSAAVAITATSNHIVLSTASNALTINANSQGSARTWSVPDISSAGTFAALEGTQTFSGAKTFSAAVTLGNGTVGAPSINLGDATTGFYRIGLNHVAIATAGVKTWDFFPTGALDATPYPILYAFAGNASTCGYELLLQTTIGVSTSATTILNMDVNSYLCQVAGTDGASNDFHDVVNISYYSGGTPGVISTATSRGSPTARTYTHSSDGLFRLAMASGTYTIRVTAYGISTR